MDRQLKQKIYGSFTKKHQLTLHSNATELLVTVLQTMDQKDHEDALNFIVETYLQQDSKKKTFGFPPRLPPTSSSSSSIPDNKTLVDFETLQKVISSVKTNDEGGAKYLKLISSFDVPRWIYYPDRKAFFP